MEDSKLNGKVIEGTLDMLKSLQEANRAIVDSTVTTYNRNSEYVQNMLLNGAEVFKSHVESGNAFTREWLELVHKQQEIFQGLVRTSMEAYLDFLYRPLSYYKQSMEAYKESIEAVEMATR